MQFLFLHIGWQLLLRYRAVRILVGALALLCMLPMLVSISGARQVRQSEMTAVSGPFAAAGLDDLGRLNIRLANYPYRFIVHADAQKAFPQAQFLQSVRPGDSLHLLVRRQDFTHAVTSADNLIVFFEMRSNQQAFLTFAASQAIIANNAHHRHPILLAFLLAILALCVMADISARFPAAPKPRPMPPAKPDKDAPWYRQK